MLRETVVVKDGEHQGLVKCFGIRKILELEGFIEERVKGFSMNLCFKLFDSFSLRNKEHLLKTRRILEDCCA